MQYREFQPSPLLSKYVECFWLLEAENMQHSRAPEVLLPDGCVELILNLGALFQEHKEAGLCELQPARFVVGQMTRPVLVSPTGAVQLLGIRFAPGGTLPFFSCPPGELTNRIVPLATVSGALDRELSGQVYEAREAAEKVRTIEALLVRQMNQKAHRGLGLHKAIASIVSCGGQVSVDRLANDFGISGRQLERRFLNEVGLGPKLFCRILRFQQVFHAVERSDTNWAQVAVDCGYFDQAHLIRDFRQFAGETPSFLLEHLTNFTESFTRKNRTSHFYNTAH